MVPIHSGVLLPHRDKQDNIDPSVNVWFWMVGGNPHIHRASPQTPHRRIPPQSRDWTQAFLLWGGHTRHCTTMPPDMLKSLEEFLQHISRSCLTELTICYLWLLYLVKQLLSSYGKDHDVYVYYYMMIQRQKTLNLTLKGKKSDRTC